MLNQKYSSANTSINKLGRLYKVFCHEKPNGKVLDFGAGKYRKGTMFLQDKGFDVDSYEPSLNDNLPSGKYNTILISNVFNVIAEDEIILQILKTCKELLKSDGRVLITVYEGDKSGKGKPSKEDCYQRNTRTAAYTWLVSKVFDTVKIKQNIIILGLQDSKYCVQYTQGVIKMICDYCGKQITGGYYKHGNGFLCEHGDCFEKQFWKDTLDNSVIVINGTAYHEDTTKEGMRCTVKFTDGTTKETWLWNNGTIPEEYNVKDNAEFI